MKMLAHTAVTSATPPICARKAGPVMRFVRSLSPTLSSSSENRLPSRGSVSPAPMRGCVCVPDVVSGGGSGSWWGVVDMVDSCGGKKESKVKAD